MTSVVTIYDDAAAVGGRDDDDDDVRGDRRDRPPPSPTASHAEVRLADGRVLRARRAIVATGGMHVDENLAGLLAPRYSYLVGLPHPPPPPPPPPPRDDDATTTTMAMVAGTMMAGGVVA
jgi:hypothetical protein